MTHKQLNKQKHDNIEDFIKKYLVITDEKYSQLLFDNAYAWLGNFFKDIPGKKGLKDAFTSMLTRGGSGFWGWWKAYYKDVDEYIYRLFTTDNRIKSLNRQELINRYNLTHSTPSGIYPPVEVFMGCFDEFEKVA